VYNPGPGNWAPERQQNVMGRGPQNSEIMPRRERGLNQWGCQNCGECPPVRWRDRGSKKMGPNRTGSPNCEEYRQGRWPEPELEPELQVSEPKTRMPRSIRPTPGPQEEELAFSGGFRGFGASLGPFFQAFRMVGGRFGRNSTNMCLHCRNTEL
jgi:hypothetical protein